MAGAPELTWQSSLFGGGEPTADGSFATVRRVELGAGAWVDHAPQWLAGSDELFARLLDEVPWGGRERWMYDRRVVEPRLTAWWSLVRDDPVPEALRRAGAALGRRYAVTFDTVGLNLYRHGRDGVAWHGDRVARTLEEPVVAIVSLGSTRRLLLRPRGGGASRRFDLGGGDLLVMGGTSQRTWQHAVPKAARAGPRISATFRHSAPGADPSRVRPLSRPAAPGG